jgi:hypothetical protein
MARTSIRRLLITVNVVLILAVVVAMTVGTTIVESGSFTFAAF